jgi:transcriptional regulator with XRE-family HTH domain
VSADGFVPTGRIDVLQWLRESSIDVEKLRAATGVSRDEFVAMLLAFEADGSCWIERGRDGSGRRTDRLRIRIAAASVLSDAQKRLIEAFGAHYPTEHWGRIGPGELSNGGSVERKQRQIVQTPQGPLPLVRQTAERLLKEGVISGEIDGVLHAADAAIVKAAIMGMQVCDFCSSPGATHFYDVPDFGVTKQPSSYAPTRETVGWLACDECDALIRDGRRKALVERAQTNMAFPKFARSAIDDMLGKFWRGMDDKAAAAGFGAALADFIEDRLPWPERRPRTDRDYRVDSIARFAGISREQAEALTRGEVGRDVVEKLAALNRAFERDIGMQAFSAKLAAGSPPPLPRIVPHWQEALDARFDAMSVIGDTIRGATDRAFYQPDSVDLNDPAAMRALIERTARAKDVEDLDFKADLAHLREAEAYSFGADPIAAIRECARLIPRESPLSSVEIPTGAGWFWFSEPLALKTSPSSNVTNALLWGWSRDAKEPTMRLAAYAVSTASSLKGRVVPSGRWTWRLSETFEEMIARCGESYDVTYSDKTVKLRSTDLDPVGRDATLAAAAELSLFFISACMWFKQKILVQSPGHVERHARKRFAREHKLAKDDRQLSVQVVALRASQRVDRPAVEGEDGVSIRAAGSRELSCWWVVKGHPRLQRCGPGLKDKKLIWIAPHPAGDRSKPFRSRARVYAVIR